MEFLVILNVLQMMVYQNIHLLKSILILYINKIYVAVQTGEYSTEALSLNHNKRWAGILNPRSKTQNTYH